MTLRDAVEIAESLGAGTTRRSTYDIVVEASSRARGLRHAIRATAPGGICTAVGYYLATNTGVPLMHMYANDITLHLGISHPRAVLPELLAWVHENEFPAELVTTPARGVRRRAFRVRSPHHQARPAPLTALSRVADDRGGATCS